MALTKIKLNTMVTGTLPDANIPDDITIDTAAAAPANALTGNTLASGVTASSLTSVGTLSSLTLGGDLTLPQKIVHSGDTDTYLSFGADSLSLYTGGTNVVDFIYGNIYIKGNNKALTGYTTGGGAKELIKIDGSDIVQIGEGQDVSITGDGARFYVKSADEELISIGRAGSSGSALDQGYIRMKSGGSNKIALHTAGDSYFNGGSLGIGTASPDNLLQLEFADGSNTTAGNIADESVTGLVLTNTTNSNGNGTMIKMESNSGSNATAIGHIQGDADSASMAFYTEMDGTFAERLRITDAGRVGIGQTTVNAMLDIDDGATGDFNDIGKAQIRVGSINNVGVRAQIGFGWGGSSTYMPVTVGAIGTSGSSYTKADFVINTRDATTDSAPTERMRITSAGQVGIGTATIASDPANIKLKVAGAIEAGHVGTTNGCDYLYGAYSNDDRVNTIGSLYSSGMMFMGFGVKARNGESGFNSSADNISWARSAVGVDGDGVKFFTTGAVSASEGSSVTVPERMRVREDGSVCIARTGALSPVAKLVVASALDGGTTPAASFQANTTTSSGSIIVFHSGDGGECGAIGMSNLNAGNSVAYNTSSDYRLKQKVKTLPNGLDRVNQMKPVEFEWKKTKDKSEGFIAHELQEICDYAVMGEKDGDRMQQVDYAKITPILVKAVQELSAKVEALENA